MGIINIEDLEAGMLLAGDVKDRSGTVVLAAGADVKAKHIRIFKAWGITEADVKGVEQEDLTTAATVRIDPALFREVETEADDLFRHNDRNHPAVDRLYHLFVRRHASLRSEGGSNGS